MEPLRRAKGNKARAAAALGLSLKSQAHGDVARAPATQGARIRRRRRGKSPGELVELSLVSRAAVTRFGESLGPRIIRLCLDAPTARADGPRGR